MSPERKAYTKSLRRIRAERNITQEYVAEFLGCDYTTYGKIEKGASALSVERAIRLALFYGVSLGDLLNLDDLREDPDFRNLIPGGDESFGTAAARGSGKPGNLQIVFNLGGEPRERTDKEQDFFRKVREGLELLGGENG